MSLQLLWDNAVDRYSPATIEIVGAYVSQAVLIAVFGSVSWSNADAKHRTAILKCIPKIFINVAAGAVSHLIAIRIMTLLRGVDFWNYSLTRMDRQVPSLGKSMYDLLRTVFVFEFFFYYLHAMMHTKWFYKTFHIVHHKFKEEVSVAAFYSHPIDFLVLNFGMVVGSSALLQVHTLGLFLNGLVAGVIALFVHTGSDIPGLMSHEGHHVSPKRNLGAIGLMDWLHGTLWEGKQAKH